ncbi:MAG: sulfatase-like hydrolase/transferase [Kiritimatiellia bacterium]|jgi:hypothetical protein
MMNKTVKLFGALSAVVLLAGTTGCARRSPRPDVVLVTLEGNLPGIEALHGSPAVVFTNMYTTSPSTLPAAATVLTGRLPPEHGLRVNGIGALAPEADTLAETLRQEGYRTGAFLATVALSPRHGLTNGFDVYQAKLSPTNIAGALTAPPSDLVDAALAFARAKDGRGRPAFIWLHIAPFAGIPPAKTDVLDAAADTAAKEIQRLFNSIGDDRAIRAVVPLFALEPAAPFVGFSLDDAATRVSASISGLPESGPQATPRSLAAVRGLIEAAALGKPAPTDRADEAYRETIMPWYVFRLPPLQIAEGMASAPALGLGPVTPQPMATQAERTVLKMNRHLGEGLIPPCAGARADRAVDAPGAERMRRAVEVLGRTGTNALAAAAALVEDYPEVPIFHEWLGEQHGLARDAMAACNAFAKVSELGYNMVYAYRQQAKCHQIVGNVPAAIDKAETAFLLNPADAFVRRELAQLLANAGATLLAHKEFQSASECLNRAAWLEPRSTEVMMQLVRLQLETGQTNNAVGILNNVLKLRPDHTAAKQLKQSLQQP